MKHNLLKILVVFVLSLCLTMAFVACGDESSKDNDNNSNGGGNDSVGGGDNTSWPTTAISAYVGAGVVPEYTGSFTSIESNMNTAGTAYFVYINGTTETATEAYIDTLETNGFAQTAASDTYTKTTAQGNVNVRLSFESARSILSIMIQLTAAANDPTEDVAEAEAEVFSTYDLPDNFKATWTDDYGSRTMIRYQKNILIFEDDVLGDYSYYFKYNASNSYTTYRYYEGEWDSGVAATTAQVTANSYLTNYLTLDMLDETFTGTETETENVLVDGVDISCDKYTSTIYSGIQIINRWYHGLYASVVVKYTTQIRGDEATVSFTLTEFDTAISGFGITDLPV